MSFYSLKRHFSPILYWARRYLTNRKYARSSSSMTTVTVDDSGITTLSLNKPPVNSLNVAMLQEISQAVKKLEDTSNCKGFVLASGVPKIFSAGLDITALHQVKAEEMGLFWRALQDVWLSLFNTRLATVAAVTGHAAAGGCLMTLCCDYRVMNGPHYIIGLNEVALGFPAPPWLRDTFEHTVGWRNAEMALSLGTLFNAEEAFKKGVVDELANSPEETLQKAKEHLRKMIAVPEHARQATKYSMRRDIVEKFLKHRDQDVEYYVKLITSADIQQGIASYFETLKKKQG